MNTSIKTIPKNLKGLFFQSSIFYSILKILTLASTIIMQLIIDISIPKKDIRQSILFIVIFTILPIIITLLEVLYFRYINSRIWEKSLNVNLNVYKNLMDKPLSYIYSKEPGELINLYRSDVTVLYSYYLVDAPSLLAEGVGALLMVIYLWYLNTTVFFIQLIAIPIIYFPTKIIIKKVMKISKNVFRINFERVSIVTNSFNKIKRIKINNFQKYQETKISKAHNNLLNTWKKVFIYDVLSVSWCKSLTGPLFLAIIFILSATKVIAGTMSLGSLILIVAYVPSITSFLQMLTTTNFNLARNNEEYKKVMELSKVDSNLNQEKYSINKIDNIYLNDISFGYKKNELIFNNLTVKFNKGNCYKIVGANGSGKTTLIDIIMGLYSPDSGEVLINDQIKLDEANLQTYYKNISYVMQDVSFITNNIKEEFKLVNNEVTEEQILNYLFMVNMDSNKYDIDFILEDISSLAENLSGGEKRKIQLAIALSQNFDVLILDEITANIDIDTIEVIFKIIKEIKSKSDKIIILISHDNSLDSLIDKTISL